MAKITSAETNESVEVLDGSEIKDFCEDVVGVPFGCKDGMCGSCIITIVEGSENLNPRNDKESDLGVKESERLACQCRIEKGEVKLKD